jgi:hypothetical protein
MKKLRLLIVTFLTLLLGVGIGLQVHGWAGRPAALPRTDLAARLPTILGGHPARDLPLGPTEAGDHIVRTVLQCDDLVYRRYVTAHGDFDLYVAYWASNKIPSELVASHTPDRCWSDCGWKCRAMKFQQRYAAGSRKLLPAEWRIFADPSGFQLVHLIYWHVVGGQSYDYGRSFNWVPNPIQYWKEHARYVLFGSGEQYFVRLTSTQDFERLWPDPDFQLVLQNLADLTLAERAHS